jgi:hypothetical protein
MRRIIDTVMHYECAVILERGRENKSLKRDDYD